MSESEVTRDDVTGARPGREAVTGEAAGRRRKRRRGRGRGEQPMVPEAEFSSYYGRPVLKRPTWKPVDVGGYLFLGGLAGASSLLAAGAQATGRPALARTAKAGAFGAVSLSTAALVHDLGRPARFLNMLRVAKVTSPLSMGSWLLTAYGPLAGTAALADIAGRPRWLRPVGTAATAGAATLGPAVATYTAVLIADTAVPAWHEGHRQMPFVFAGSAASAAAGLGMLGAPTGQAGPARRLALVGGALELGAVQAMKRRMGMVAEPYEQGKAGRLMRASEALTATGAALAATAGRRSRAASAVAGAALLAGSAALRFGVFHAGVASAEDPKYTVVPQRERLRRREQEQQQQREQQDEET